MRHRLRSGLAALALGALVAHPASAQTDITCNVNAEAAAGKLRQAVAAAPKTTKNELAALDQMVETCPTDRGVIVYNAEAWLMHAYAGIPDAEAFTAVSHVWDMLYDADAIIRDPQPGGTNRDYGQIFYELRKPAAIGLIRFHDQLGTKHPLFETDAPFDRCLIWNGNLAQTLFYELDNSWKSEGALIMIRKLAQACAAETGLNAYPWWLQAARGFAAHTDDTDLALELLNAARADSVLYLNGKESAYQWSAEDQAQLDALYEEISFAALTETDLIPVEALFTAENLGSEEAARSIGWRLDQVWGEHYTTADDIATQEEFLAQMKAYTLTVTPMFNAAKATSPEARKFLFEVAKAHAEGKWRRIETRNIPGPRDYMYVWIDPDYTPPAPSAD